MNLREIAHALQERLDFMMKMDDKPWEDWLAVYTALAQVHQAMALERIAEHIENGQIAILNAGMV